MFVLLLFQLARQLPLLLCLKAFFPYFILTQVHALVEPAKIRPPKRFKASTNEPLVTSTALVDEHTGGVVDNVSMKQFVPTVQNRLPDVNLTIEEEKVLRGGGGGAGIKLIGFVPRSYLEGDLAAVLWLGWTRPQLVRQGHTFGLKRLGQGFDC